MKTTTLVILFLGFFLPLAGQPVYETRIRDRNVLSLQVTNSNPLLHTPVYTLHTGQFIEIAFDLRGHQSTVYSYTFIHCNADWQASRLLPFEYLEGFVEPQLQPVGYSRNTLVPYTHYRIRVPDEQIQIKQSGNYVVIISEEADPGSVLLTACFSVVDPLLQIQGEITGNQRPDTGPTRQQLSFSLRTNDHHITDPENELCFSIQQNSSIFCNTLSLSPSSVSSRGIHYDRNPHLVFEAGNEYRKVEFLGSTFPGTHVRKIEKDHSGFRIVMQTDDMQASRPYVFTTDQNGFYRTGCAVCEDPALEADYYRVCFSLASENLLPEEVWLDGDFIRPLPDKPQPMKYDPDKKQYEQEILLKGGSYNYRYLAGETKSPSHTEGSYHQTENEYHLYIYYRAPGAGYDRLAGYTVLRNR
ncbi:MAG: DUF5103 domain-containing protein [Tannerellaceae bacterium]|nr:DUF5103 domain-containing protein [Tannerellaceae bacterium]